MKLRIGYSRAALLMDLLEERNVIGPANGAAPRVVYPTANNVGDEAVDGDEGTELEIEIDDPELGHVKGDDIDEVIKEYERLTDER